MLIHKLKISGLLSFGPNGVNLPMEPLNVLIGPNGSGKSNLLEVLALLQHAPRELDEAIRRDGVVGVALEGRRDAGRSGCRGHCSRSKGRTFGSSSDGFRQLRRTLQSNRRKDRIP